MTIGAIDRQTDRNPCPFTQQTPFDAAFGPVGGIGPRFFPLPAGLSSSLHPSTANPNQCLCIRHTPATLSARTSKILPLAPISETGRAPPIPNKSLSHPAPSTDIRSVTQKKSRPSLADPVLASSRLLEDGDSISAESMPPASATIYLKFGNDLISALSSGVAASCPVVFLHSSDTSSLPKVSDFLPVNF